jgi:hypothetical protein
VDSDLQRVLNIEYRDWMNRLTAVMRERNSELANL